MSKLTVTQHFKNVLKSLGVDAKTGTARSIAVVLDAGAISGLSHPDACSNGSPIGLTLEEVLEIAMVAGANPYVR